MKGLSEAISDFFNIPSLGITEASAKYEGMMRFSYDEAGNIQLSFFLFPDMIGPRITISHVVW